METLFRKKLSIARLGFGAVVWTLAASLGAIAMAQEVNQDVDSDVSQEADQATETEDAPYRVARLSFTQGGVSLQPVGETQWNDALLNRPVVPGDYLRTDPSGRAELQVDQATVRLGSGSNFTILSLGDREFRMRVTAGVINVRVRDLGESETIEIETPQATMAVLRPGNYRLEVSAGGDATVVKVSNGLLEARGPADQSFVVRPQQVATLTGTNHLSFRTAMLGAPDSFDEWSLQRDQQAERALSTESSRYVSNDTVGYEDLDENGTWRDDPEYGYVWAPTHVVAGWSPYRFGRYSYVSGWGWTWIDDAPWGYAPFHYGNWVTVGGRWCWVPGPRHRPIGGRPDRPPSNNWHIQPPPPRGIITRNIPNQRDGERVGNSRFRSTRPDNSENRYTRPAVSPTDTGQVGIPAVTGRPGEDRRMYIPRHERPQSTYPAQNTYPRVGSRERSTYGGRSGTTAPPQPRVEQPRRDFQRPEASRPSQPPPQQQASRPTDNGSRGSMGRGDNGARSHNTRER